VACREGDRLVAAQEETAGFVLGCLHGKIEDGLGGKGREERDSAPRSIQRCACVSCGWFAGGAEARVSAVQSS
jgi:hypothetical protein